MNKIEKLIAKLCTNGVEYIQLGNILDYEQPTKYIVHSTEYDDDYQTPVLTAGQSFILGYTDETEGIYNASIECPTIIFDDFTTSFHWVDFCFKVKSSAMKMLRPKNLNINFRYVYYAMCSLKFEATEHTRHWISRYSKFEIPVPPLKIQQEIVRILDNFTNLKAELQAELQARIEQYEYYRNQLLTFSKDARDVKWMRLGDVGNVCMCKRIMKNETSALGEIPFYKIGTFGGHADAYISKELYESYKAKFSYPHKGDILISASGTIGRTVIFDGEPSYFQDSNIVWINNDESVVLNKFLYYWYKIVDWKTDGGTIKRLYNDNLKSTEIVVPSLSEQQRIVSILDNFEFLVNDRNNGLPSEIEAVQEQYEYYRDKLLTFERKA